MSSSPSDETQNPKSDPTADHPKTLDPPNPDQESTDPSPAPEETENQEEEEGESTDPSPAPEETENQEEEEGECGFCLFMKGGACKEVFINWEKCIEEGEKNNEDIVDKCFEVTSALKKCMEANPEYYGPILQAEKAAEQEAIKQLDKEKEASAAAAATSDTGEEQQKSVSS